MPEVESPAIGEPGDPNRDGNGGGFRKTSIKRAIRSKLSKIKLRKKRRPQPPPFPYSLETGKGCSFLICFNPPQLPPDSPIRVAFVDPKATKKKPSSYDDFLRSVLEKNDFYSKDCNVHQDIAKKTDGG